MVKKKSESSSILTVTWRRQWEGLLRHIAGDRFELQRGLSAELFVRMDPVIN